jgi:hypothetical protein
MNKLEKIKKLISHKNPNPTYAELLSLMADRVLKAIDPEQKAEIRPRATAPTEVQTKALTNHGTKTTPPAEKRRGESIDPSTTRSPSKPNAPSKPSTPRGHIPVFLRRFVWARDGGKCTYVNSSTGVQCNSQFKLELDHIVPVALGGQSTAQNLKLVCAAHNQLSAIKIFGHKQMQQHVPSLTKECVDKARSAMRFWSETRRTTFKKPEHPRCGL